MRSVRWVIIGVLAFLIGVVSGRQALSSLLPHVQAEGALRITMAAPGPTPSRAADRRARRSRTQRQRRGQAAGPVCQKREQKIGETLRAYRACRTDDDCRMLVRGCSPYLTCGMPVNEAGIGPVKTVIAEYVKQCPETTPICAACLQRSAVCEAGLCRLDPPLVCSKELRTCSDGSSVSRNVDYDCKFDPCPVQSTGGDQPIAPAANGEGSGQ